MHSPFMLRAFASLVQRPPCRRLTIGCRGRAMVRLGTQTSACCGEKGFPWFFVTVFPHVSIAFRPCPFSMTSPAFHEARC